ncbi:MAG: methyltransferase domain-containing protein [Deltaproteobacteria bacterium]|nr:methyltransferase domain-containing protein [Deltaproteobacteria bacterium]
MNEKLRALARSISRLKPVRPQNDPSAALYPSFIERLKTEKPGGRVLEVGSRNVTGNPLRKDLAGFEYVGLDIHPGENVDVVGDAHKLSQLFAAESFDAVVSVAVFEHLIFPWKVAMEMNKVLKPGGRVLIATHPTWPAHELPWDFFRYQENGMRALFNKATGFDIVAVKEGLPARLIPLVLAIPYATLGFYNVNLTVVMEAVKVGEVDSRLMWDVPVDEITDTMYPKKNE